MSDEALALVFCEHLCPTGDPVWPDDALAPDTGRPWAGGPAQGRISRIGRRGAAAGTARGRARAHKERAAFMMQT